MHWLNYGKTRGGHSPDGRVVPGMEHQITGRSAGFPAALVQPCLPRNFFGNWHSAAALLREDVHEIGGFVSRCVVTDEGAFVLYGRLRSLPEGGKGTATRHYSHFSVLAVPVRDWTPQVIEQAGRLLFKTHLGEPDVTQIDRSSGFSIAPTVAATGPTMGAEQASRGRDASFVWPERWHGQPAIEVQMTTRGGGLDASLGALLRLCRDSGLPDWQLAVLPIAIGLVDEARIGSYPPGIMDRGSGPARLGLLRDAAAPNACTERQVFAAGSLAPVRASGEVDWPLRFVPALWPPFVPWHSQPDPHVPPASDDRADLLTAQFAHELVHEAEWIGRCCPQLQGVAVRLEVFLQAILAEGLDEAALLSPLAAALGICPRSDAQPISTLWTRMEQDFCALSFETDCDVESFEHAAFALIRGFARL